MKPTKYIRRGHVIHLIETNQDLGFKSINKAKKESRRIQANLDGALGRGSVEKG